MPDEKTAGEKPPSGKIIEVEYRLLADEDGGGDADAAPAVPGPAAPGLEPGFLDPAYDRLLTARLLWTVKGGAAVEIPFRDPAAFQDALELEYVLGGEPALNALAAQLDLAVLLALTGRLPATPSEPRRDPLPMPNRLVLDLPRMASRLRRDMGLIHGEFMSGPPAWTDDMIVQLSPETHKRLLIQANEAMSDALEVIWKKVQDALRLTEKMARGVLAMTLDSARNEVVREALRYFNFEGTAGAEAALENVKSPMAKAEEDARASKAADVAKMPVHRLPARLQAALKRLKPLAEEVLKKRKDAAEEKRKFDEKAFFRLTIVDPSQMNEKLRAAEEAAQVLALEAGKLREAHPVAVRLSVEETVKAGDAARDVLGGILFPILGRAFKSNRKVRAELADWGEVAPALRGMEMEGILAVKAKNAPGRNIWQYRKYIDRALMMLYPDGSGVGYAAASRALDLIHGEREYGNMLGALMLDMAVFHAAHALDEAAAAKLAKEIAKKGAAEVGEKAAQRFVPIVNWAFAAESIVTQVKEYLDGDDFFYCTLDPKDALVETAPKLWSLMGGVGMEIAFALY